MLDESRIQWEIIAGPRGIQRMVSEQRQRGVLLPFTVSLIKGCRFAHVSALTSAAGGRSPVLNADGVVSWSKYLKHGDTVQIHGSYFRVISGDELLSAYDDSNEVESERIDLNREESDHDDESSDSGNEKGGMVYSYHFYFSRCNLIEILLQLMSLRLSVKRLFEKLMAY